MAGYALGGMRLPQKPRQLPARPVPYQPVAGYQQPMGQAPQAPFPPQPQFTSPTGYQALAAPNIRTLAAVKPKPKPKAKLRPNTPMPGPVAGPGRLVMSPRHIATQAEGLAAVGGAEGTAGKRKRDQLLRFGSRELARKLIGDDPAFDEESFINTIPEGEEANTVLGQLLNAYNKNQFNTIEGRNQQNLFYSGAKDRDLTNLAGDYTRDIGTAEFGLREGIGDIDEWLAGVKDDWRRAILESSAEDTMAPAPAPTTKTGKVVRGVLGRLANPKRYKKR